MRSVLIMTMLVGPMLAGCQSQNERLQYPATKKADQVDDYFGTRVADPYRWLEDVDSDETRDWVEAQNKVSFGYLESIPERERIRERLTRLWNYERYGLPSKEGDFYVFSRNDGLQNQSVVYKARNLEAEPSVLIDPNTLAADGTVALTGDAFSQDGRYLAYATSASGSDWKEWHVREVESSSDLPDILRWSKFSGASWKKDGSGIFYSRYDEPKEGETFEGVNKNQKVYFHRLNTPQSDDELVYRRPDQPDWGFEAEVTEDGRFLLISQTEGTEPKNRMFIRDLNNPKAAIESFLDRFDAEYTIVGNDGARFYVRTDKGAPRGRLVAIEWKRPAPDQWVEIIPEAPGRDVLADATLIGDKFVVVWQTDAHHRLEIYDLAGKSEREVPLPAIGNVSVGGKRKDKEFFYSFTSFTYPTTIYRYDIATGENAVFRRPQVDFQPEDYETVQVFYPSGDGTRIPMFLTYRKGLQRNGMNPTYLYGYGGFNITVTPSFSAANLAWVEMGGIYAVANLRGGGEYGNEWHDGGRLQTKQNVFDDFIAAAEWLIAQKYTSTPRLAIGGASNGGLLVGACITQRPDLFGAALPAVGVMDMLRFQKFTIGWAWVSDYGSSDSREGFDTLIRYSPLHNIRPGTKYPPTLVTTADHDDRVVPGHSFKFAAALQAAQAGEAPVIIRIETKAGHGAGKPTSKQIEERADAWAFLVKALGMKLPG